MVKVLESKLAEHNTMSLKQTLLVSISKLAVERSIGVGLLVGLLLALLWR